jgi:hypothetical protein
MMNPCASSASWNWAICQSSTIATTQIATSAATPTTATAVHGLGHPQPLRLIVACNRVLPR